MPVHVHTTLKVRQGATQCKIIDYCRRVITLSKIIYYYSCSYMHMWVAMLYGLVTTYFLFLETGLLEEKSIHSGRDPRALM